MGVDALAGYEIGEFGHGGTSRTVLRTGDGPAVVVMAAAGALGGAALVLGILVAVPYVALLVVVLTALNAVFQTALYLYATTGSVPTGFDDSNLQASFSIR